MNIILIGMPACGKSTVGVLVAKKLGFAFVDTDLVIQEQQGKLLQQILDEQGVDALLEAEKKAIKSLKVSKTVVATGGSAVFSSDAMEHLKKDGVAVYIKLPFHIIDQRLNDLDTRGVAGSATKTLAEIFDERAPFYEKYADVTLSAENMSAEAVANAIIGAVCK